MNTLARVEAEYKRIYPGQPLLVRSPGRVNLIGEHTDYNEGYVLPAAIDKSMYFAIAPRTDNVCSVHALDMNDSHEFSTGSQCHSPKHWPDYLMGVVDQFVKGSFPIGGFNCVFGGDIPIGAGLSSSAALEAGLAFALNAIFDSGIDDLSLVKLAQKAENEFVGVRCGIMDQYINIFGRQGIVLRIDCRSLDHQKYAFDYPVAIVLFDTRVSHSLASSEYNKRRMECSEGVAVIRKKYPGVTHLRDVSVSMLAEFQGSMSETVYQRCLYVVEEIDRLLRACEALERRDLDTFGRHMYETHAGLSLKYGVSCPELDYLVELVQGRAGVYGARMMGGGFGGCTINLVEKDALEDLSALVGEHYGKRFGTEPRRYITSVAPGTRTVTVHDSAEH